MAENGREKAEKSTQSYAALSVGFVCIIVGLPLWWKTTEVYRVQLPYQEINNLAKSQVTYSVHFSTVVFGEDVPKTDLALFGEKLKSAFDSLDDNHDGLSVEYRGQVRQSSSEEYKLFGKSTSLKDLDSALGIADNQPDYGKIQFILLPPGAHITLSTAWVGKHRRVFMPAKKDIETVIPDLSSVLRELLVSESTIAKAFHTARGAVLTQADKESMRSLKSHPGYEVTFTLLNPEPDVLDAQWDVKKALKEYMAPMLKAFAPFAEINVKSQYLHYTGLGVHPDKDDSSEGFKLKPDQLPHIITPIEAYLGSHASVNPNLNFVLYMTPRKHYPLHIYNSNGELHPTNSFLSPRWGGIMVYNSPLLEGSSAPARVDLDMKPIMEVFLSQLRLLLGINPPHSHVDVTIEQPGKAVVSEWELDQWLRLRSVENIGTAVATLKSLAQLLEEISNIVINDDIGREVERAVTSIHEARRYLDQGRLNEAFVYSRQALLSSEKAFFDPSLLELLYFPEDQKFAIYIPLFLPISIPVIMSVMQALKRVTGRDKVKQE